MKCDEQLPVCQNCINSKRKCYRGIRLNFTQYTIYDPQTTSAGARSAVGGGNAGGAAGFFRLLDQLVAVLAHYKNGRRRYRPYLHLHTQNDLDEAALHYHQELNCNKAPTIDITSGGNDPPVTDIDLLYHPLAPAPPPPPQPLAFPMDPPPLMPGDPSNPWHLMYNIADDVILENYDIKNVLMNPEIHGSTTAPQSKSPELPIGVLTSALDTPLPHMPPAMSTLTSHGVESAMQPPPTSHSRSGFDILAELGTQLTTADSAAFVKLLHKEHYYWILDLFNEIDVWKSMVPNYCVRILQAAEFGPDKPRNSKNPGFLLQCLLVCQEFTLVESIVQNAREQQVHWGDFDFKDVTAASYKTFEQVLVSVVLILLSMLIKTTQPGFVITETYIMVLSNQGKLIRKLVARFQRIPDSVFKSLPTSLLTAASFQAIAILRFLLKMQLKKIDPDFDFGQSANSDTSSSPIFYDQNYEYSIGDFFDLSPFEQSHLSAGFRHLDINESDKGKNSDSAQLRTFLWSLIELDYYGDKTGSGPTFMPRHPYDDQKVCALRPNDRCIALNILVAYSQKIRNRGDVDAPPTDKNTKLHELFQMIHLSSFSQGTKTKWTANFLWTLEA